MSSLLPSVLTVASGSFPRSPLWRFRGLTNRLFSLGAVAILLFQLLPARANGQCFWNVQAGDWSNPAYWSGGAVPGPFDDAYIDNGGTATITQTGESCWGLAVGDTAQGGTIQMTTGSLNVTGAAGYLGSNAYIGYGSANTGTFTQSGGTIVFTCALAWVAQAPCFSATSEASDTIT